MSRHSHSQRHRSSRHSREPHCDMETDIKSVKEILTQIDDMLSDRPHEWTAYLSAARSAMATLDRLHFFRISQRREEHIWLIQILQDYAYHDADEGRIGDVADWCQRSWLRILRDHPENVTILTGLGQNWLQRSQACLARIHQIEGSDSSSGGASGDSGGAAAATLAAQRVQGPLYVEARGCLQPAVDFFTRAIRAAEQKGSLDGELLALGAEAYISFGNVSSNPAGEQHFAKAIRYLRRAQAIQNYPLSTYLQQFLEDYGRYVSM